MDGPSAFWSFVDLKALHGGVFCVVCFICGVETSGSVSKMLYQLRFAGGSVSRQSV
jgi:hypothetical protein